MSTLPAPRNEIPVKPDTSLASLISVVAAGVATVAAGSSPPDQTLQATGLVHEAYLKLVDQSQVDWRGRSHFMATAAKVMRNILIDRARQRAALKRGGDWQRITLSLEPAANPGLDADQLLGLNAALERLAERDLRQARVVELRCFGGLKVDEVAAALDMSKRSVEGYWTHAQAWLRRELSRGGEA